MHPSFPGLADPTLEPNQPPPSARGSPISPWNGGKILRLRFSVLRACEQMPYDPIWMGDRSEEATEPEDG